MKKTVSSIIALLVCAAAWGQKYKDSYAFDLKGDVKMCVTTYPSGNKDTIRFTEEGALVDGRKEVIRTEDGLPKTIITKRDTDDMADSPLLLLALLFYDNSNDTTQYVFMGGDFVPQKIRKRNKPVPIRQWRCGRHAPRIAGEE